MDEQENTPTRETVRLRHPHTGDVQEVEADAGETGAVDGPGLCAGQGGE